MFDNPSRSVAHTLTGLFCTLLNHFGALKNNFMRSSGPSHAPLLSSLAASLRHS